MKKIAIILSMIAIAACSEGPSKDGENQLPQPAQNSGTATEADRANEAVKDSVEADHHAQDSTQRHMPKK